MKLRHLYKLNSTSGILRNVHRQRVYIMAANGPFLKDLFVTSEEDKVMLTTTMARCIIILGKGVFLALFKWKFLADENNQIIKTNN